MQGVVKTLSLCGLALGVSSWLAVAQAQDYIDVEAERADKARQAAAADPYGSQPATAYPATSYGINTAPTASTVEPPPLASAAGGNQNLGNLLYQLQQLQKEVMMLNGKVEEQAHELRKLKQQSLERYVDIDRRLGGAAAAPAASGSSASTAPASKPTVSPAVVATGSSSSVPEQPGEGEAYRAAYSLVRQQQFESAISSFQQFLSDYPAGKYAANAHYWLGELYLVIKPPNLESARQSFMLLLDQYPGNSKVPDAMYKLGKVHFMKGNRERSREFLDRLIAEYGASNNSAVNLAREFIKQENL